MNNKKTAVLDLRGCKHYLEFHERIRVALGFPEGCGANWNAFEDFLLTETEVDELLICGEKTLPFDLANKIPIFHRILDKKIADTERSHELYSDIIPFRYRIID